MRKLLKHKIILLNIKQNEIKTSLIKQLFSVLFAPLSLSHKMSSSHKNRKSLNHLELKLDNLQQQHDNSKLNCHAFFSHEKKDRWNLKKICENISSDEVEALLGLRQSYDRIFFENKYDS